MSHTSDPTAQDTHHPMHGHAGNGQPVQESPRAAEEEKEQQEAVHEDHLSEARKEGKNGKAEQTKREEGHKQEVDFDNFDQFEDAPPHPEEQPASKLPPGQQIQKEERQHGLSKVSQQQQGERKEDDKNAYKKSVGSTQQKIEEPPHYVSTKAHKSISSQNAEVQGEAPSAIRRSTSQAPTSFLSGKTTELIRQAEKERIGFTYGIFLKYNKEYQKIVSSHKFIIRNVCTELASKHAIKKDLQASLMYYFETYIKIHSEFYERSSKVHKEQAMIATVNKFANIREELKDGYDLLFSVRKTLTDEMQKLEEYIINYTFKSLDEAFVTYHKQQKEEEKRQSETIDQYEDAEKQFMDLFEEIEKQFKRGMGGEKTKEDLFICIVKFINEETDYRQKLIKYGKTVLEFKKTFSMSEKQLFAALQRTINEFKLESRKVFATSKKEEFCFTENYLREIEAKCGFAQLCTITDMDYIRSVLELQNRKECGGLSDKHFQEYLQMSFFDRFVGNKQDLFKGAINRCFPLRQINEELVHTISGYLVHYNRETHECKDKFNTKKLNAKVFAEGAVQLDEVVKGFLFSSNRTAKLQLQSQDTAEQLICYLNEKDQWKEGEGRK